MTRITVITPSYNQAAYLPGTMDSVLGQEGRGRDFALEYLVVDGGSTDGSAALVAARAGELAWWTSERDRGQPHAINKGLARATGDVVAFINSDDQYLPGALARAARAFAADPGLEWWCAGVVDGEAPDRPRRVFRPRPTSFLQSLGRREQAMHQPGMFWRRSLFDRVGPFPEDLQYGFDHWWWCRALQLGVVPVLDPEPVAFFRLHPASKTVSSRERFERDSWEVYRRFEASLSRAERASVQADLRLWAADGFVDRVYAALREGGRSAGLRKLAAGRRHWRVMPPRLLAGAAWRCAVTGRPPAWAVNRPPAP